MFNNVSPTTRSTSAPNEVVSSNQTKSDRVCPSSCEEPFMLQNLFPSNLPSLPSDHSTSNFSSRKISFSKPNFTKKSITPPPSLVGRPYLQNSKVDATALDSLKTENFKLKKEISRLQDENGDLKIKNSKASEMIEHLLAQNRSLVSDVNRMNTVLQHEATVLKNEAQELTNRAHILNATASIIIIDETSNF